MYYFTLPEGCPRVPPPARPFAGPGPTRVPVGEPKVPAPPTPFGRPGEGMTLPVSVFKKNPAR